MCGSNTSINYPAQPSYGESLAESLKAQADFLKGTGDFRDVGSLESLLPLEESVRKKTAQTDTDVLRQTLLGNTRTFQEGAGGQTQLTERGQLAMRPFYSAKNSEFPNFGINKSNPDGSTHGIEVFDTKTGQTFKRVPVKSFKTAQSKPDNLTKMAIESKIKDGGTYYGVDFSRTLNDSQAEYDKIPTPSKPTGVTRTERVGDGMVDLVGDIRDLTQYETRTATQADVNAGLADKVGDNFVQAIQTDDQAGFRDGEFQGLSVLAEDIQRGNLSRQREADLQDVSRLSGLYQGIMEDYKPGTQSAMQGAKDLIEEQKDNLLKDVGISDPAQVASQGVQADPLRQNLMLQANEALGQGLTDREERLISNAARARSTLMGRTFDQSGAIAEAEALVAEDNQREMQNRGFAQDVLGQEAGIQTADDTRRMGADQFNVGTKMDAERLRESLRQQGLLGYLDAASRISQIENQDQLDPFRAILGRGGGTALQQGQSVFGQAGYGLNSGPQYLNPEAGLGFIQNQATNAANMYGAQQAAQGSATSGIFQGLGALGGGIASRVIGKYCWVAREVYGVHNPAWLLFREWMLNESPGWFRATYIKFGERFAKFISNKPRLKARIRLWMDSKIGGK